MSHHSVVIPCKYDSRAEGCLNPECRFYHASKSEGKERRRERSPRRESSRYYGRDKSRSRSRSRDRERKSSRYESTKYDNTRYDTTKYDNIRHDYHTSRRVSRSRSPLPSGRGRGDDRSRTSYRYKSRSRSRSRSRSPVGSRRRSRSRSRDRYTLRDHRSYRRDPPRRRREKSTVKCRIDGCSQFPTLGYHCCYLHKNNEHEAQRPVLPPAPVEQKFIPRSPSNSPPRSPRTPPPMSPGRRLC